MVVAFGSFDLSSFRGFESFVGMWHGGGDHKLHVTAADVHHAATSVGYDFHKVDIL